MFSKAWINLAILLLPIALIFDVPALLVISAFLLTAVPLAWWWTRASLKSVTFERSMGVRRAFPGEVVELTLRIANEKLLPLGWLAVEDRWSLALPMQDGEMYEDVTERVFFYLIRDFIEGIQVGILADDVTSHGRYTIQQG